MDRRRQILQHQQQRFRHHVSTSDAQAFFDLLMAPELLKRVESSLPAHRERLFPPTEKLSMFLAQAMNADRCCQQAVNDFSIKRSCNGMKPNSTRTGAFCRARQRLPVEMVSTLVRHTASSISDQAPSSWRWRGRPLRLVDGTTVSMDVGFYYMSNALGRLVGTLLSGWVFQAYGLEACLWVSSMFVLTAALISIGLPRHHEMKQQTH